VYWTTSGLDDEVVFTGVVHSNYINAHLPYDQAKFRLYKQSARVLVSASDNNPLDELYRTLLTVLGNDWWLGNLKVDQAVSLRNPGCEKDEKQEFLHETSEM
jgi:hypothetical protein